MGATSDTDVPWAQPNSLQHVAIPGAPKPHHPLTEVPPPPLAADSHFTVDIDTLSDVAGKFATAAKSLDGSLRDLFAELGAGGPASGRSRITDDVSVLGDYGAAHDLSATVKRAEQVVREAADNFGLTNLADVVGASATCYRKAEEDVVGAVNKVAAARRVDSTVGVNRSVPGHPEEMQVQFPLQTGRSGVGSSLVTNPFNNGMPIYDPPFELPNGAGEVKIRQAASEGWGHSGPGDFEALNHMVESMMPQCLWEVAGVYRGMAKAVNGSVATCRAPARRLAEAWSGKVARVATTAIRTVYRSQAGFVSSLTDMADALEWHGSKQRAWQHAIAQMNADRMKYMDDLAGTAAVEAGQYYALLVGRIMEDLQQQTNETIMAFPETMPVSFAKTSQKKGYRDAESDASSLW